jgi:hypothetical protein
MSTKSGSPPPTVWLGHELLATTQKYLEPSKETEKQLEWAGSKQVGLENT